MARITFLRAMALVVLMLVTGCAKRVLISYKQAQPQALVKIKTVSGKSVTGIVRANKPNFVILQTDKHRKNSLVKINQNEISSIWGQKDVEQDAVGKIISPWEIEERTGNKNKLLYTFGGMGLSFGISFFLGSLIYRGIDDVEKGKTAMWTTTGIGTVLGTFLFARSGAKKDRQLAIDKIRKERYELAQKKAEQERIKRKKIMQEIERLKRERQRQDEELRRLKEQAQKKKKK